MTQTVLCQQLRENEAALSPDELAYIDMLKDAAISYIKSHTGIDGVEEDDENGRKLDDYPDLTYALLALVSEMYDNRQLTVSSDKVSPTVTAILSMHDFNLIPEREKE